MRDNEKPMFDIDGWSARTRHGMVWKLFPDKERQSNPDIYLEAVEAVNTIITTGQPLTGSWR